MGVLPNNHSLEAREREILPPSSSSPNHVLSALQADNFFLCGRFRESATVRNKKGTQGGEGGEKQERREKRRFGAEKHPLIVCTYGMS